MKPPADAREAAQRAALAAVIRPIVRGQLRSARRDHPQAVGAGWMCSIEKRIVNDLLSRASVVRLRAALCGTKDAEDAAGEAVVEHCGFGAGGVARMPSALVPTEGRRL